MKKQIQNKIDKQIACFKNWLRYKLKNWLYPVNENIMWNSAIYDLYPLTMVIDINERSTRVDYADEMKYKASRQFGMEVYNRNLINIEKENLDCTGQRPPWIKRYRLYILVAVMREERKPKVMSPSDIIPYRATVPNQKPFFGNPNVMS